VRFGLAVMNDFPAGSEIAPRIDQLKEQVIAAREAGMDSVWVLQHYLGQMPTLQPIPLLGALSAVSGDMFIGTNMFILPLRHPVAVAEEYATLDHLTNGHVIAGFGMGYRENEFEAFNVPMDERATRYEESVQLIRQLWTGKAVTFEGKHFNLDNESLSLPPVQPNGPRIWIGAGAHKTGARRAARLGDGWIMPPHVSPERMREIMVTYNGELDRLGRRQGHEFIIRRECLLDHDPAAARELGVAVRGRLSNAYAAYNAPDTTGVYKHLEGAEAAAEVADESYLFTDPETAVRKLKALEADGITYVVLRMQWFDLPQERMLQSLQLFKDEVLPHFTTSNENR
jgi:alkanesulfonate monooxygenase SsuD/methylene tetrahydromethanopterin reductase-like flavin-dependent oxidoreductase (luciferase family)